MGPVIAVDRRIHRPAGRPTLGVRVVHGVHSLPCSGVVIAPQPRLDSGTKMEHRSRYVQFGRDVMIRAVVEEAAALASLALFLGMIAIWAQVIATF